MIACTGLSNQTISDEDAKCLEQLLLDSMQDLQPFRQDDSPILGSILVGDVYANELKLECHVKGTVNASNFLHFYSLMSFRQRDQIGQKVLDLANVDDTGAILILKAVPIYEPGKDDFIDILGNVIVLERFYMMLKMESNMWVLSTLGGGFSAMADCGLRRCAESALSISKKQLKLARSIGDEVLMVRCYVYIGFALAQLDRFKEAFQMLMNCRLLAKNLKSGMLDDIIAALFMKIKYLGPESKVVKSRKFQQLSSIYEHSY